MATPIQPRQNVENAVPASMQPIAGHSAQAVGTEPDRLTSMQDRSPCCGCFANVFNIIKGWFNSAWSFFTGRTSSTDNQSDTNNAVSHQQLIESANRLLGVGFDELPQTFPQKAVIQLYFNEQVVGLYLEEIAEAPAVAAFRNTLQQNMANILREQNLDAQVEVKVATSFFVYNAEHPDGPVFDITEASNRQNLLNGNPTGFAGGSLVTLDDLHHYPLFQHVSEEDRRRAVQFLLAGHAQNPAAI